jgi:hypothetical protein
MTSSYSLHYFLTVILTSRDAAGYYLGLPIAAFLFHFLEMLQAHGGIIKMWISPKNKKVDS